MNADVRFWDRIADRYSKKPFPHPEATEKKIAITRGFLRPRYRVLDIGCATGTIPLALAPSVGTVLGIDVSPAMIAIAERRAAEAGATNVKFRVAPGGALDGIDDGSFDCVCAYNVLHLVADPAALLGAIHRVLRPGGAFVSSTPCLGGTWLPPYAVIIPVMRWLGLAPAVTMIRAADLRLWFEDAGFEGVELPDVGETGPGVFATARKPAAA